MTNSLRSCGLKMKRKPVDAGCDSAYMVCAGRWKKVGCSESLFLATRETIQLNPEHFITDLIEFEQSLAAAGTASDPTSRLRFLDQARALYHGELLAGFYQDVFLAHRSLIAAKYRNMLRDRVRALEELGNLEGAIEACRDVVAQDSLNEDAYAALMQLYAAAGRPSEVSRLYRELEDILLSEFGVKPNDAIRDLAQRLRGETEFSLPAVPIAGIKTNATEQRSHEHQFHLPLPRRRNVVRLVGSLVVISAFAVGLFAANRRAHESVSLRAKPKFATGHLLLRWRLQPKPGDRDSEPVAIVSDRDGYVYVGGSVQTMDHDVDMVIAKFDPNGQQLWEQRENGTGNDVDRIKSLVIDSASNVYYTGETFGKSGSGTERLCEFDILTVKRNKNGVVVWKQKYDGEKHGLDSPADIACDSEGNVYVVGRSWDGIGLLHSIVTLKYSPTGKRLWEHRFRPPGRDANPVNIAVSKSGVYIAGHSFPEPGKGISENHLYKLDPSGALMWIENQQGVVQQAASAPRVAVDREDAVYFASETLRVENHPPKSTRGHSTQPRIPLNIISLTRHTADGKTDWKQTLPIQPGDSPTDLKSDPRGGVVIGAVKREYVCAMVVSCVDGKGSLRYQYRLPVEPGPNGRRTTVSVDEDGNVAAAGMRYTDFARPSSQADDAVVMFVNVSKQQAWTAIYDGPDHQNDSARAITNRAGRIYAAIQTTEGGTSNLQILKYSPFAESKLR